MDNKVKIQKALNDFEVKNTFDASINFFKTLGYDTSMEERLTEPSFSAFKKEYIDNPNIAQHVAFNESDALAAQWVSVDFLFQMAGNLSDYDNTFNTNYKEKVLNTTNETPFNNDTKSSTTTLEESNATQEIYSYIFFMIELEKSEYTRSSLAAITRQVNKCFSMPVMLLFRYGDKITLSVINRRLNKIDNSRDVLEKVSLIKDINIKDTHRSHIDLLNNLSISNLQKARPFNDFVGFHNALLGALDIKILNDEFYNKISAWYFYSCDKVQFPNALDSRGKKYDEYINETDEEHNQNSLIRFISRLLFVWFIKERALIDKDFFDPAWVENNLKDFNANGAGSAYYRAILQNLFFGALNRPISSRGFVTDKNKYNKQMGVDSLLRYKPLFNNENTALRFLEKLNECTPFMNGGLFECLDISRNNPDKLKKDGTPYTQKIYIEGFSNEANRAAVFPDELLFGGERVVDLSKYYGDSKHKEVKVQGIIPLLKSYKFTLAENTPIEEDIALDPELLGRVFENLLASVNSETKESARKSTGSFYTPREIVDYMVVQSLKESLKAAAPNNNIDALFDYTKEVTLTQDECKTLVNKIAALKVLDPACGSGAFPMGVLQRLVWLLNKIDADNTLWKSEQLERAKKEFNAVNNKEEWEKVEKNINDIFAQSDYELDYTRKLYLIENCIYGVDIQPIAVQLTKLRCFITLICEQKADFTKENFGIVPLPNLETKFIAANTLIGLEGTNELTSDEIEKTRVAIAANRHALFSATNKKKKEELRGNDEKLRQKLSNELSSLGFGENDAKKIADWQPFNKEASAAWFSGKWMFGVDTAGGKGFDIVLGNPPYGAKTSAKDKAYYKVHYAACKSEKGLKGSTDTFAVFINQGLNLLKKDGVLSFIAPMAFTSSDAMCALHKKIFEECERIFVSNYAVRPEPIFKNAVVDVSILLCNKTFTACKDLYSTKMHRKGKGFTIQDLLDNLQFAKVNDYCLQGRIPKVSTPIEISILEKLSIKHKISDIIKDKGKPIYYRAAGGRYFKVITNYSTGSSAEKVLIFDENVADLIGCILSSSLAFWFYQVYSDNHNWKGYEIGEFRTPPLYNNEKGIKIKEEMLALYSEYLSDIEKNAIVHETSGESSYKVPTFKEYKIRKSKALIDKIDDLICPLYGLTKEETDFIKNYEIEFRVDE